jgi:hypothetical protein
MVMTSNELQAKSNKELSYDTPWEMPPKLPW